jgi:hypothetical protein
MPDYRRRFAWVTLLAIVVLIGAALAVGRSDRPDPQRTVPSYQRR